MVTDLGFLDWQALCRSPDFLRSAVQAHFDNIFDRQLPENFAIFCKHRSRVGQIRNGQDLILFLVGGAKSFFIRHLDYDSDADTECETTDNSETEESDSETEDSETAESDSEEEFIWSI